MDDTAFSVERQPRLLVRDRNTLRDKHYLKLLDLYYDELDKTHENINISDIFYKEIE